MYFTVLPHPSRPGAAVPIAGPYPTADAARRALAVDQLTARLAGFISPRAILTIGWTDQAPAAYMGPARDDEPTGYAPIGYYDPIDTGSGTVDHDDPRRGR